MKIEQIQQVVEVYRVGSINKAAQTLYMAQSTLSSSIQSVEKELRHKIFIRGQKGTELTEFGHAFIKYGQEILESYQNILAAAQCTEQTMQNAKFGISVYYLLFANRIFYQLYKKYRSHNIDFSYKNDSRDRIIADVAKGVSELGILVMPSLFKVQWLDLIHSHQLEYFILSIEQPQVLFGSQCQLSCSPQHSVSVKELSAANIDIITIKEHSALFKAMEAEVVKIFRPKKQIQISDRDLLTGMLLQSNGYYVATMNKNAYKEEAYHPNIHSLPVENAPFQFEIGFVKKQNTILSDIALEFLNMIRSAVVGR